MALPYRAAIIAKKKAHQLYYYVVESARIEGRPRIVQQTYLGTAERVAARVKDRTAPLSLSATPLDDGLPGALWLAAQKSGVWEVLDSLWPKPRSGPSTAHYLLLAAIHRICRHENRSPRLVPSYGSAFAVGLSTRRLYLATVLGLL
jgi:hypothetical protein